MKARHCWAIASCLACSEPSDPASSEGPQDAERPFFIDLDSPPLRRLDAEVTKPPSPEACALTCAYLTACVTEPNDESCKGVGPGDEESFAQRCAELCALGAGFETVVRVEQSCAEAVALARSASIALAYDCAERPPPESVVCRSFADRVATCTANSCPPALPITAGISSWLRQSCELGVAAGLVDEAALGARITVDTPCEEPAVQGQVTDLIGAPPSSVGPLTQLCEVGPARDAFTCGRACHNLRPCLPPRSSLREAEYCAFVCAVDVSLQDAFSCVADSPGCAAAGSCF